MVGQTVSHCRILEKLSGGGMGVVCKAEDTRLSHEVALKLLPDAFAHNLEQKDHASPAARHCGWVRIG